MLHHHLRPLHTASATALLVALLATLLPTSSHSQVYRCGNTYSHTPSCTDGKDAVLHTGSDSSHAHQQARKAHSQAQQEARDWDRTERELDKAEAQAPLKRGNRKNTGACEAASRRIQKIDELARRGGPAQKMERLREERQRARDRQFNAGC